MSIQPTSNDDAFDLVDRAFGNLADKEARLGIHSLSDSEKVLLLLWDAAGVLGNGGFHYVFEKGMRLDDLASCYEQIGMTDAASITKLASSEIEDIDPNDLCSILARVESKREVFSALGRRLCAINERDLVRKLIVVVRGL